MNIHLETHHDETAYGLRVLSPLMVHSTAPVIQSFGETYLDRRDVMVSVLNAVGGEPITVQGTVVQLFHVLVENGHVIQVRANEIATDLTATGTRSNTRYTLRPIGFDHRASGVSQSCAIVTMTYGIEKGATEVGRLHEDIHLFVDADGDLRSIIDGYIIE